MTTDKISNIRNVSIVAHHGAGKTLMTEALLFNAKVLKTFSAMGDKPCPLDEDPEEKQRGMTLTPQVYTFTHHQQEINIIDTPGYTNFLADVRYCLMASDAAILIVSALSGVKETSLEFWEALKECNMPTLIFVNKMDREKANFTNSLASIEKSFGIKPICFNIPIGAEHELTGVIDIVSMKARKYAPDKSGKFKEEEIPESFLEEAKRHRQNLMESIIETDESVMNAYLEGKDISFDELKPLLRKAVFKRDVIPVLGGSAARNVGLRSLLDAVYDYIPSPDQHIREWAGQNPDDGSKAKRRAAVDAPFSGFVFKTSVDHFAGKVNYCRIVSGKLKLGDTVLVSNTGKKVRIDHLAVPFGRKLKKAPEACAGEIVALEKVEHLETNGTISDPVNPIFYPPVRRPSQLISYAVVPRDRSSAGRLSESLFKIMEEDPNIEYHQEEATNELLLSGMGQVHLEIVKEKLKRKYDVAIELKVPSVPYRETIKGTARAQGKYKKQTGGHGQYGDCWIEIEPLPRNSGFEFVDKIVGGVIPKNFIPAVQKGIEDAMARGFLAGYPVVDLKATLYDGSYHSVDSSDLAFQIAASFAWKSCMEKAKPVLLEPIMNVKITVPTDTMGAVIQDLNSRRGRVLGVEPKADAQIIRAKVPMAEMLEYDITLKGITQGKGIFTMAHDTYEEVPSPIAAKIIEKSKTATQNPKS